MLKSPQRGVLKTKPPYKSCCSTFRMNSDARGHFAFYALRALRNSLEHGTCSQNAIPCLLALRCIGTRGCPSAPYSPSTQTTSVCSIVHCQSSPDKTIHGDAAPTGLRPFSEQQMPVSCPNTPPPYLNYTATPKASHSPSATQTAIPQKSTPKHNTTSPHGLRID
jgi:hypothetical protein